jgi:RNA ligase (TIGR02306 family)
MKLEKIKSIRKITNTSKKYDIEVFKQHCYFANDILIHNSSATFYVKDGVFGVCSRNLELKFDENNAFWKLAIKYDIENKLKQHFENRNIAIQGEAYGLGLNGNLLTIPDIRFAAFNLFDIDNQKYLNLSDLVLFTKSAEIPMVDIIEIGEFFTYTLEDLVKIANNLRYPNDNLAEGIVIRPTTETHSVVLNSRLSGKVISEEFELKHG